jgi:acyl-CoA thioesterase FadM
MLQIIKRQEETISEAEVQLVTVNKDGKPIKIPEILEKLFD